MKRVFVSRNIAEVGLLKSLLEQEGIVCITRNEQLATTTGLPVTNMLPELWVNDDDAARAERLVARWHEQPEDKYEPWTCPNCGEEIEGQFGACWRCGEPLDEDGTASG